MKQKIIVEEHFATEETARNPRDWFPEEVWSVLKRRLLDIHDERLREMDNNGVELMLLSLTSPAVQAIPDVKRADDLSRRANDYLAEQVLRRPERFQGLAALPMQDPELAIKEMRRCIGELGFKGVLVNGYSQVGEDGHAVYYDHPVYRPFWAALQELRVPFFLHPRAATPANAHIYDGHPWLLGAAWAFGQETAVHALRLMGSGLFDEFPNIDIVLGHMGEGLPFSMWRVDNCNAWTMLRNKNAAKRPMAEYFQANFHVATSGNFRTQALINTILEIGADRILFAADWPYESIEQAARWFDALPISAADMQKIARGNTIKLFKLDKG